MRSNLVIASILALVQTAAMAQDTITQQNLSDWEPTWRFSAGDSIAWADPTYADDDWEVLASSLFDPGPVDSSNWGGIGWFRTCFQVDSSLSDVSLAYTVSLSGAATLYLDGTVLEQWGTPAASLEHESPVQVTAAQGHLGLIPALSEGSHCFAARVSNLFLSREGKTTFGFEFTVDETSKVAQTIVDQARTHATILYLLAGIAAILALVYLFLFAYQPKQVGNLLFSLLAAFSAVVIFSDLFSQTVKDVDQYIVWRRYLALAGTAGWIAGVRLIGLSFFKESFKLFPVLFAIAGLVGLYVFLDPIGGFWSLEVLSILALVELIRRVGLAVFLSRPGALVVAVGTILLVLGGLHDVLHEMDIIRPLAGGYSLFHFGLIAFLALLAVFMVTDYARTNRMLSLQIAQVAREGEKALQEEKINQNQRIDRIKAELESRAKQFEDEKSREASGVRKALTVAEGRLEETKQRLIQATEQATLGNLTPGIANDLSSILQTTTGIGKLSADLVDELETSVMKPSSSTQSADLIRQLRQNLDRIKSQHEKATTVVQDILEHEQADSEFRPVEINAFLERYINMTLRATQGIHRGTDLLIERVFDDKAGSIVVPPRQLGQALLHVLRNAIEAVLAHAEEIGEDFQPTITVSSQRLDNAILVRIRDNGPGVEQELRDRVFESMFSTKDNHSGLGLTMARTIIVDKIGGTFGLEHFKEQGAGFYMTMPLSRESAEEDLETDSE